MENPNTWTALERCIQSALASYKDDPEVSYWIAQAIDDDGLFIDDDEAHDYIDTMSEIIQLTMNKYQKYLEADEGVGSLSIETVIAEKLRRMNVIDEEMDV